MYVFREALVPQQTYECIMDDRYYFELGFPSIAMDFLLWMTSDKMNK